VSAALSAFHFLCRGHWPEVAYLDTERICLICDVGRPTGSSISTGYPPANSSPLMNQGLVWRGGFAL
jgi:hypothetical protein